MLRPIMPAQHCIPKVVCGVVTTSSPHMYELMSLKTLNTSLAVSRHRSNPETGSNAHMQLCAQSGASHQNTSKGQLSTSGGK
jgi:hypothetical protein